MWTGTSGKPTESGTVAASISAASVLSIIANLIRDGFKSRGRHDEPNHEGTRIPTVFFGGAVKPDGEQISHYSVLRTIEATYGLLLLEKYSYIVTDRG